MKLLTKSNLSIGLSIIALTCAGILVFKSLNTPRIAYIRSTQLVYGYFGMKAAHETYQNKSVVWKANIDTLQNDYKNALGRYKALEASLSKDEKERQEKMLMQQQQDLVNYSTAINNKAKEEDEKITQGVLNQVNSFVEDYGKSHGYDVILGTTLSGSVLYGDKAIDITDEVLTALNKSYKGDGHE